MRPRQMLLLSVLLVVVPALVFGSGGFSEVAGERGIDVAVVDDKNAYLGIEVDSSGGYINGKPFTMLWLTDRAPDDLHLQSVSADGPIAIETDTQPPIDLDDSTPIKARCESPGEETTVTIKAVSSSVTITVDKTVAVDCDRPKVVNVEFTGCGKGAQVSVEPQNAEVNVTKVVDNPSTDGVSTSTETINSNGKVGPGQGGKLVAIEAGGERYENTNTCADEGGSDTVTTTAQSE